MKQFLCELLFSCLLAAPAARSIDDLTYGTALYAYYQEDYQQALLDVLVAESQGRVGDDPVRFLLARGSFAFQEGMHRYAADTFASVDPVELDGLDRMRLAFHLAREHHRTGDWTALQRELAVIDTGMPSRARQRPHPEVSFMQAESALARGDRAAADRALAALDERDEQLAYGLFNLGVARRAAGDAAGAEAAFARLAGLRARTPEAWDLVQRGRLALAVLSRERGAATSAEKLLASLPAEGRYRDPALASYGRLAMAREDHELAARVWLTLIARSEWSGSHAEAYLGLPLALEQLAGPGQALPRYQAAEQIFADRLTALEDAAARARDPAWIRELAAAYAVAATDSHARPLTDLDAGLGVDGWVSWLADESVHQLLSQWRELDVMADWLAELPDRLSALQGVTAERRRRSAAAHEMLGAEQLTERRRELAARIGTLEADLQVLTQAVPQPHPDWMRRLADHDERRLVERLTAMAELAGRHAEGRDRERLMARIHRLQGVVFWQIADDRSARLRELERQLREARSLLADTDARIERLSEAEARFAAGVEADFGAFALRADDVSGQVRSAMRLRERALAEALEQRIEQDREQTRRFLLATRVAIARTTDRLAASTAGPGGES